LESKLVTSLNSFLNACDALDLRQESHHLRNDVNQAWWNTLVVLPLGRLRQKDYDFEASLGYNSVILSEKIKEEMV
jgi:hypothetical protein